jgi:hypothetical protein
MNYSLPLAAATLRTLYAALSAFAVDLARFARVLYHRLCEGKAVLLDSRRAGPRTTSRPLWAITILCLIHHTVYIHLL